MNKLVITTGSIIVVMVAVFSLGLTNNDVQHFEPTKILPTTETVPFVKADTTFCENTIDEAKTKSQMDFKQPFIIPNGYMLQESSAIEGQVTLYYAPGPTCGPNATFNSLSDGILRVFIADERGDTLAGKDIVELQTRKANLQDPETAQIFEINGNPAMGWETGFKNSVAKFENGTVLQIEKVAYPAKLVFIDQKAKVVYKIDGYFNLDDLKKIASSFR
ncbi:MAG: hypothetical protein QXN55_08005 [Candidatus Nitrosotenuis sp.]